MPALLATLQDLLAGAVLAIVIFLLAVLVREWFRATRVTEAERYRPKPVEPYCPAAVIAEHLALRDRHEEARELGRAA